MGLDLAALGALVLPAADGRDVRLGELWERAAEPVVIVWLRHFGCSLCREHVAELRALEPDLARRGARLALIGCGTREQAARFAAAHGLAANHGLAAHPGSAATLLADPALASHGAAGLRRGVVATLEPRAAVRALGALLKGHLPRGLRGDPWQQGGSLVVAPGGEVLWHHAARFTGDRATNADLLAAVDRGLRAA